MRRRLAPKAALLRFDEMSEKDRTTGAPGFRSYADDTSREPTDVPQEHEEASPTWIAQPLRPEFAREEADASSTTVDPLPPPQALGGLGREARVRARGGGFGRLATAVAACAVGIGIGLGWAGLNDRTLRPGSAASPAAPQRQALPPPQAPSAQGSALDARAPEPPSAAPRAAPPQRPSPAPGARGAEADNSPAAAPPSASTARPAEAPVAIAAPGSDASANAIHPSAPPSDCFDAGTLAGQLGCDDPRIAQAHSQMARAYRRALDAGVPAEQLSAGQARWLGQRARAAQTSPDALLEAYRQRTRDLAAFEP